MCWCLFSQTVSMGHTFFFCISDSVGKGMSFSEESQDFSGQLHDFTMCFLSINSSAKASEGCSAHRRWCQESHHLCSSKGDVIWGELEVGCPKFPAPKASSNGTSFVKSSSQWEVLCIQNTALSTANKFGPQPQAGFRMDVEGLEGEILGIVGRTLQMKWMGRWVAQNHWHAQRNGPSKFSKCSVRRCQNWHSKLKQHCGPKNFIQIPNDFSWHPNLQPKW